MADFLSAYRKTIEIDEGGFRLHDVPGDAGGKTFAGIAYNFNRNWPGWQYVFSGKGSSPECRRLVEKFYRDKYWRSLQGDAIRHQAIAEALFNFSMNSTISNSVRYVQYCLDCAPDGRLGPVTLDAINRLEGDAVELLLSQFVLMRIGHRVKRIRKDPSQLKFAGGWLLRDLRALDEFMNVAQFFGIS